jgi:diguanylate cyclase (GGDEF)-like protein/PAS domain S-box-containing protein
MRKSKNTENVLIGVNQDVNEQNAPTSLWLRLSSAMLGPNIAWVVLFVGLLATFEIHKSAQEALLRQQQTQFDERVSHLVAVIRSRLKSYEDMLRGGVGLLAASESVSRARWKDYNDSLAVQERYPGVQGVGYSVFIPAAQLDEHVRTIRKGGLPDYAVRPAGARAEYTSILYLEPFDTRNQRAFGFDMFSEANRRTAMERARDTGDTAMSAKVTLVQETDKAVQAGMLMYLPHYKNGAPHNTPAERRANLLGYVYSPFRLTDLMNDIMKRYRTGAAPMIDVALYDGALLSADSLFHNSGSGFAPVPGQPVSGRLTSTQSMGMYGHTWSLYAVSRPTFHAAFDQNKPLRLLLSGAGLSVTLSMLVYLLALHRRRTLAQVRHLTRQAAEREKTAEQLQLSASVYQHSSEAMSVTDSKGKIVSINHAFTAITGYTLEEVAGKSHKHLASDRHDRAFYQTMWSDINATGKWQGEISNRRKNGEVYLESMTINAIYHVDGSAHRYVALSSDITQKKAADELIWKQANFDTLTGLPNRRLFDERLTLEIKKSQGSDLKMALLLIDLDHFKEVNDTLGHDQGDNLLALAAQRITACVHESDHVAHLEGDKFLVLLPTIPNDGWTGRIAQNIIERLATPFQLLEDMVFVTASVGITVYPDDGQNVESLIKNADRAMYDAKNSGRNRFNYFTKALRESADNRQRLIRDLRHALADKQLEVYYQPIVETATGKIYKAEALLRWRHPELGMVGPHQFIPLAEQSGLIHEIGDWVLHQVTHQLVRWRELFVPELQVSLNVSAVQFQQNMADHLSSWISHLQAAGLPGESLILEITESLSLDTENHVTDTLQSFRRAGIQVALDDFGTGYSSLSYLKKFNVDYLKIDKSFVRHLVDEADDRAMCQMIIVMAHKLGLKVVAEGVETEQQRDLLAAEGCDYLQGWLYGKAVPAREFSALLHEQAK